MNLSLQRINSRADWFLQPWLNNQSWKWKIFEFKQLIHWEFFWIIIFSNFIYIYISSSSCRAASTDIPDPLSPLLPIVLQGYIPYPHIAAICMFELVVLLLPGHMWGSIGVHHLWARPCFSSSVLVRLTWIVFMMGGRWPYSWCLVGCCRQDLFNIARNILV